MANYEQLKNFYPQDMGTKKGYCLQNVAKGFHVYPSKDPSGSAKEDMQRNKNKGTFHNGLNGIPTNCAVPIYQDTISKNEHIMVYDKGIYYSDGKKISRPSNIFGWGEWCNGYQIVKAKATAGFLPAKGYWKYGDKDPRIGKLCNFYANNFYSYFCKNRVQAHAKLDGNLFGKNCEKWTREFQKRTGLYPDGMVGKITYAKLKQYGFKA